MGFVLTAYHARVLIHGAHFQCVQQARGLRPQALLRTERLRRWRQWNSKLDFFRRGHFSRAFESGFFRCLELPRLATIVQGLVSP